MCPASHPRASILIVDDEKVVRESLRFTLKGDHELHTAATARQALCHVRQHAIDLAFLDIRLPDMNGIDVLKQIKQIAPATRVIIMTAVQAVETAVDAMKNGALDFMAKPLDMRRAQVLTKQALAWKKARTPISAKKRIIGAEVKHASTVEPILKIIESILPYEGHVLIAGPNGSGKQQLARALHNRGSRAAGYLRAIDCASMPAKRIEKAFGGLHRGALPDALSNGPDQNDHEPFASLFLNHISHLPLDLQDRLLDLIKQPAYEHPKADVRIIAATTQSLKPLIDAGLFRKDLYARLNALPISLPLLRLNGENIGLLLELFRKHHARYGDDKCYDLATDARPGATLGDWPNSVREFEHLVTRLCSQTCQAVDLLETPTPDGPDGFSGSDLKTATRAFECEYITAALKASNGNRSQAARWLGIHRNTLRLKIKELGIDFH